MRLRICAGPGPAHPWHCHSQRRACANIPTGSGIAPADGLHLDVVAGQIIVTNAAGSQVFDPGQCGFVPSANVPRALCRRKTGSASRYLP